MTAAPQLSRRSLLAGGLGATALTAMTACSGGQSAAASSTLNVWGGVPAESGPGDVVEAFQAAHPEYTVTYTRFINDTSGNLKLDTALQGGVDIDVYFTYPMESLALRAGSDMTLDLTERVEADPELAPFLDTEAPKGYWQDGQLRALATTGGPNLVLVNADRLADAGLEIPERWDLEEYVDALRQLTTDDSYGSYALPDTARIALGPDYWYTSSGESNFQHPAFLEHLGLSRDLIDEGVLFPWTEVLARQLDVYQQNGFLAGEFALWATEPFALRYLSDAENYPHDFKVAALPTPTLGDGWNGGRYGNFVMINPRSTKQDLAWEFIRFWVTEGSAPMAAGGKIPTLDNVPREDMLATLLGPDADQWFDVDSLARGLYPEDLRLFVDSNLTALPEITLAVKQQEDLCWIGERSPQAAIDAIDTQATAAIDRYGRND